MSSESKKVALITGASSGIGLEMAKLHAIREGDLVLVARREKRLKELKTYLLEKHPSIRIEIIVQDLSEKDAALKIYQTTKKMGLRIDYLINNAGYGGHDFFHEREWKTHEAMIQVNLVSLTQMTRLFLDEMLEQGSGKILNVASTAGFIPGPLQAVYYASKGYVISFSQAIASELQDYNISVTVVCPGATDTEFMDVANSKGTRAFKRGLSCAEEVAKKAYKGMIKGKVLVVPSLQDRVLLFFSRFMPRSLIVKLSRLMMEKVS